MTVNDNIYKTEAQKIRWLNEHKYKVAAHRNITEYYIQTKI